MIRIPFEHWADEHMVPQRRHRDMHPAWGNTIRREVMRVSDPRDMPSRLRLWAIVTASMTVAALCGFVAGRVL